MNTQRESAPGAESGDRLRVGVVGCGTISPVYLDNLKRHQEVQTVACADIDPERARRRARDHGVPTACSVDELLADPGVDLVVNLTVPRAHAPVSLAAIRAGKHVYSEKPLGISRQEGKAIIEAAGRNGVTVGCAPDTFLGAGIQTCRKLIDDGAIGKPVAATACFTNHGHEHWHPDPAFFYKPGGGPMLDMGPYYLTALVNLLGPVRRACGLHRRTFPQRTITSQPGYGRKIEVEVATHVAGVLEFATGAIGTILTSFDVWGAQLPRIEVYGTEGSISVPDPNQFGGPVRLLRAGAKAWEDVPLSHEEGARGIGIADMAGALREGRRCRAGGRLAAHVLDVMMSIDEAAGSGRYVELETTCERPDPLPAGRVAAGSGA